MTVDEAKIILAPFNSSGDHELEQRGDEWWWWFYYEPGAEEPHEGIGSLDAAVANIKRCYETDLGSGFYMPRAKP